MRQHSLTAIPIPEVFEPRKEADKEALRMLWAIAWHKTHPGAELPAGMEWAQTMPAEIQDDRQI